MALSAHLRMAALLATLAYLLSIIAGRAAAQPEPSPPQMLADAQLNDVVFVDTQRGWAVGDRGVIWHSDDGGRNWRRQNSTVACSLQSVSFIDAEIGWAVGGWTHPYTHKTTGVVLRTHNGGRHWTRQPSPMLPALHGVKFFDTRNGWALGNASAMYPAGVFRTSDGGRHWIPLPGARSRGWLAGDFPDPRGGAIAGRDGALATIWKNQLQPSQMASLGNRSLRELRLVGHTDGYLVGDGALVLQTADGGSSWQTPTGALPEGIANQFDFAAVAAYRDQCWIAGQPGSCVLHSADSGRTWKVQPTGQDLPIHALAFVDENHGWAVGAMGTILATQDGGSTWQRRRGGGSRAALLGIYGQPSSAALEVFARLCGNDGYLGVAHFLTRRDVEIAANDESPLPERAHQALVAVGASAASSAWRYPMRQAGLHLSAEAIVAGFDRANDGRGLANLREHVVRLIRQWRPEVILTDVFDPRGDDPLAHVVTQIVFSAVEEAADATAYTEQITVARLQPWQVKKVFGALPEDRQGTINVTPSQLAPNLGRSLADCASTPRGLIEKRRPVSPVSIGFQLLINRLPDDVARHDFFSGVILHPGGDARRDSLAPAAANLAALQRAAQKRRNVEQMLARARQNPSGGAGWLGQIGDLTDGLHERAAGDILDRMARQYHASGRASLATETFELLTSRYPQHPHSEAALIWLVRYYGSSEAAWRERSATQLRSSRGLAVVDASSAGSTTSAHPAAARFERLAGFDTTAFQNRPQQRVEQALALGKVIQRTRPALFAEPAVRFPLAAAQAKHGAPRDAERFYQHRSSSTAGDVWSTCAKAELWLRHNRGLCPKPVYSVATAPTKPKLDGILDEPIWKNAEPLMLRSALHDDAGWGAVVMLTCDREFLYLAVSCRKAPEGQYPHSNEPRPRDADLSRSDRVDLLIDVDRDYASFYRLTVDHRGWTGEACLGDTTWNPTWYVAAASDEATWVVEAAIAWRELAAQAPASDDAWAVGLQRTVPGVGFQSWSEPAAVEVLPQGFGLLIFD